MALTRLAFLATEGRKRRICLEPKLLQVTRRMPGSFELAIGRRSRLPMQFQFHTVDVTEGLCKGLAGAATATTTSAAAAFGGLLMMSLAALCASSMWILIRADAVRIINKESL